MKYKVIVRTFETDYLADAFKKAIENSAGFSDSGLTVEVREEVPDETLNEYTKRKVKESSEK
jgi:hypothetical protein